MRAGIGRLGLGPGEFWTLTPAELLLMLGLDGGTAPLSRTRLEALAAQFPDVAKGQEEDDGDRRSGRSHRGA